MLEMGLWRPSARSLCWRMFSVGPAPILESTELIEILPSFLYLPLPLLTSFHSSLPLQNSHIFPPHTYTHNEFIFFYVLVLQGIELRSLHLVGRHCTPWAMPPALLALVI
jgi:hypothetical protein